MHSFLNFFRAFATHESGEPIDRDKEHIERKLLDEYKAKLSINDKILPDPTDLKEGWIGEEVGIKLWPQLYLTDIIYLCFCTCSFCSFFGRSNRFDSNYLYNAMSSFVNLSLHLPGKEDSC